MPRPTCSGASSSPPSSPPASGCSRRCSSYGRPRCDSPQTRPGDTEVVRSAYSGRFMSAHELTVPAEVPALPTLEVVWQQDASAYVFTRSSDGTLSAGHLHVGMPSVHDLAHIGHTVSARKVGVPDLLRLADAHPEGLELGGTARATFAVIELARRSVAEGLVHPQLDHGEGSWFAFWGATLDD